MDQSPKPKAGDRVFLLDQVEVKTWGKISLHEQMPVKATTYKWLLCFPLKLLICNIHPKETLPFWEVLFHCTPSFQHNWIHLRYCKELSQSEQMWSCQCFHGGTKLAVQESHTSQDEVKSGTGWKRACDRKLSSSAPVLPMFAMHKQWKDPEEEERCWHEEGFPHGSIDIHLLSLESYAATLVVIFSDLCPLPDHMLIITS